MYTKNSLEQHHTQVKGMTMHTNKQIDAFISNLVSTYSCYDSNTDSYIVDVDHIADFDLNKIANLIMSTDDALANEATGCDNPHYYTHMLPALQTFLSNSTSIDHTFDFAKAWQDGITKYFIPIIQELLDKHCSSRVVDEYDRHGKYSHTNNNNTLYWRA
jgi:hypothetical protein